MLLTIATVYKHVYKEIMNVINLSLYVNIIKDTHHWHLQRWLICNNIFFNTLIHICRWIKNFTFMNLLFLAHHKITISSLKGKLFQGKEKLIFTQQLILDLIICRIISRIVYNVNRNFLLECIKEFISCFLNSASSSALINLAATFLLFQSKDQD